MEALTCEVIRISSLYPGPDQYAPPPQGHTLIFSRSGNKLHPILSCRRNARSASNDCRMSALEMCSRRGAIQIHVYLTLPDDVNC